MNEAAAKVSQVSGFVFDQKWHDMHSGIAHAHVVRVAKFHPSSCGNERSGNGKRGKANKRNNAKHPTSRQRVVEGPTVDPVAGPTATCVPTTAYNHHLIWLITRPAIKLSQSVAASHVYTQPTTVSLSHGGNNNPRNMMAALFLLKGMLIFLCRKKWLQFIFLFKHIEHRSKYL